jgi:hypothetical protein
MPQQHGKPAAIRLDILDHYVDVVELQYMQRLLLQSAFEPDIRMGRCLRGDHLGGSTILHWLQVRGDELPRSCLVATANADWPKQIPVLRVRFQKSSDAPPECEKRAVVALVL